MRWRGIRLSVAAAVAVALLQLAPELGGHL
jgi:hypothetical protein